jgi:hypothetical protein
LSIPKRFQLAGLEVTVEEDGTLVANKSVIGEARYAAQKILIDKTAASKELTTQSFLHEVTHWILYVMGEEELRNNEKFVDLFAQFWYQYEKTKEMDTEKPSGEHQTNS